MFALQVLFLGQVWLDDSHVIFLTWWLEFVWHDWISGIDFFYLMRSQSNVLSDFPWQGWLSYSFLWALWTGSLYCYLCTKHSSTKYLLELWFIISTLRIDIMSLQVLSIDRTPNSRFSITVPIRMKSWSAEVSSDSWVGKPSTGGFDIVQSLLKFLLLLSRLSSFLSLPLLLCPQSVLLLGFIFFDLELLVLLQLKLSIDV